MQRFIQDALRDILDVCCVVYIDDILIFSKTKEVKHLKMVLERLKKASLYADLKKCTFLFEEVEFLRFPHEWRRSENGRKEAD